MSLEDNTQTSNQNNGGSSNSNFAHGAGAGSSFGSEHMNQKSTNRSSSGQWDFHQSLFSMPMSANPGHEYYNELTKELAEVFKATQKNIKVSMLDMSINEVPSLSFSCVVIACAIDGIPGIAYHTLILEATNDPLDRQQETLPNNVQINIVRPASDARNARLIQIAADIVRKAFPKTAMFDTGATRVPRSFDPKNKTSVHRLAFNTTIACATELEVRRPDFQDVNLSTKSASGDTLTVEVTFPRVPDTDIIGNPLRNNVQLAFSSRKGGKNQSKEANSGDRNRNVSVVKGYIDAVWDPAIDSNRHHMMNWQDPKHAMMEFVKYRANYVITDIVQNFAFTPASIMLAILTSGGLSRDNNWVQAFKPVQVQGIDLTDIGALNHEANILRDPSGYGGKFETKDTKTTLADIGRFVSTVFYPELLVSIDCVEAGPQSWFTDLFQAAAAGDNHARNNIYDATCELTGGAFERHYPRNAPIFYDRQDIQHAGYWFDHSGVKRDLRELDYIAVANLRGEVDPKFLRDWTETFNNRDYPLLQRYAAREKMLMVLSNETAVIEARYTRCTFTGEFMNAAAAAANDAGLRIGTVTPMSSGEFSNIRHGAGFGTVIGMNPQFMNNPQYGFGNSQWGANTAYRNF